MKKAKQAKPKRSSATEPSAASLRDIPELDLSTAVKLGRGAAGMRNAIEFAQAVRGRPKAGAKPAGSSVRSLRLTDEAWAELERQAVLLDTTLHKLVVYIVVGWLHGGTYPKATGLKLALKRYAQQRGLKA